MEGTTAQFMGTIAELKRFILNLWMALKRCHLKSTNSQDGDLLFPSRAGVMLNRKGEEVTPMLSRARKAAGIPDLAFRHCRTTFATLHRGEPRDPPAEPGPQ